VPWPGAISGNVKKNHEDGLINQSLNVIEKFFVPFRELRWPGDNA